MNFVGRKCLLVLKKVVTILLIIAFVTIFYGCGTEEEKKTKHLANAQKYVKSLEYKKAVQAEQGNAKAHYQLAVAYLATAQTKLALEEFEKSIGLDPDNLDAQLKVGQFYLASKRTKEANIKAEFVLSHEPENIEALFLKVGALLQTNSIEKSTQILKHIIELDDKNTRAFVSLA